MTFVPLTFILLFCHIVLANSTNLDEHYAPHITAILNYLNSNPNKVYNYKSGTLVNAQQKADIIELTINIDVICVLNTQYLEVPCTERPQICNGFVQQNLNTNEYTILSDVTCQPKGDSSAENADDLTTVLPVGTEQESKIELSHEAVSSDQNADFVAVKVDRGPCLGCPFDLDTNVEGVSTLVDTALRHVESEKTQRQTAVKVIKLQQQVVAGVKYILTLEMAPTLCQKSVDLSSNNCPIDNNALTYVCEVIFLQRPWINKLKHIIKNNCTNSQEYNIDLEKHGDSNNNNKIKTNSSLGNSKTDEINSDILFDLESQILPVEQEKIPITDNNANLNIKTVKGPKFQEPLNNNNPNSHVQETACTVGIANENIIPNISLNKDTGNKDNTDNSNSSARTLGSSSEEDIEHNEVKRSVEEVNEIQQGDKEENIASLPLGNKQNRFRRDVLVGAPIEIDVNDSRIRDFTTDALTKLDSLSENPNRHKVVEVVSATSQVVAGAKYTIKAKISLTDCPKNDSTLLEDCRFLQNTKVKQCDIIVWDRPWLHKHEITLKCDDDDKKYTFEILSAKNKRSINRDNKKAIEHYTENPRLLGYVKTGLRHLNSKSEYETEYVVKKVVKISKQIVSGKLWQITVELGLSNCPKDNIEPCQNVETNESRTCDFAVWEQPWLTDMPKINIHCENETEFYIVPANKQNSGNYPYKTFRLFQDFMMKHNKSYVNEIDFNYRLKIFKDNLNTIKLLNKYEQGTARYGITQFADLTSTEFSKSHGLRMDLHNENDISFMTAITPNITLPEEFDWRTKGVVTKVKNQGSCGSCWAFSTTGNVEGQYAIKYGKLVEFSEQELVDCDKLDEGCNGGLMDNAYRSIEEIGGLEMESDYPYDAEDEKCNFNISKVRAQIAGALNISHNETDMAKWLVKHGPIAIAINANAMQFYVGGVSHPWKILCNPKSLDHGVLIVGYGVHHYPLFNKTLPYWIIKNSWGPSWGEQGYYRIYRGDGSCGVNETPSSSIVA